MRVHPHAQESLWWTHFFRVTLHVVWYKINKTCFLFEPIRSSVKSPRSVTMGKSRSDFSRTVRNLSLAQPANPLTRQRRLEARNVRFGQPATRTINLAPFGDSSQRRARQTNRCSHHDTPSQCSRLVYFWDNPSEIVAIIKNTFYVYLIVDVGQ